MADNPERIIKENFDNKILVSLNLFWLGFIIYIASFSIANTDQVNYIVCNIFQILGLLLMIPSAIVTMRPKIDNKYLNILFILYFIWLLVTIIRGIEFDYLSVKRMLFDTNFGILLYLVPLVLLFPGDLLFFKKLFKVIIILSIVFLLYDIIFLKQLLNPLNDNRSRGIIENFSQHMSFPCGFILLTYVYQTKKRSLFALFVLVLTFMLAVIRARRGLMFVSFTMLIFTYIMYQYANRERFINIILSLFLILIVSYVAVKVYEQNRKDTFSLITERLTQHTRTEVEQYFYRDMKIKDWIIGKGMNGQYFCPGVEEGVGRISIYRHVIETGYLQIILAGGIISVGLMLLIAIPAIFMGLFRSKNILSKASAVWIVIFLLYLYPGTPTIFSLNYILVWLSISLCYSRKIRNYSDDFIQEVITGNQKFLPATDYLKV